MTIKDGARTTSGAEATDARIFITAGALGAALAVLCCTTPLLAVVLGAVGLTAWIAKADYVLIPVFILGLALIGFGFYRRRPRAI